MIYNTFGINFLRYLAHNVNLEEYKNKFQSEIIYD